MPAAEDCARLVGAIDRYLQDAPAGLTMDRALDLSPGRGQSPWWREEDRQEQHALVRALVSDHFAEASLVDVLAAAARYEGGAWIRHRRSTNPPTGIPAVQLARWSILRLGPFPGERHLRRLLTDRT